MPQLLNYRRKWRDEQFNGSEAAAHPPGNDSAITWSIIFALTGVPHREGANNKVYQLSGYRNAAPALS